MNNRIKRLRVFAGPNGSGKSTLYDYLVRTHSFNAYYHINPDDISKDLPVSFNLSNWPITFSKEELFSFIDNSSFQERSSVRLSDRLIVQELIISLKDVDSSTITYLSAALASFLRMKMISSGSSFSFESVFSHPSKIDELIAAQKMGYRVYLYYIATSDPLINQQRVQNRVHLGGHSVPDGKIKERYYRTMENLYKAFCVSDRVFFFDNSDGKSIGSYSFFAEKKDNKLYLAHTEFPDWFNVYILKRL